MPTMPVDPATPAPIATPAADAASLERVLFEVKRVIVGQERVVERLLVGLLARGHCLLEGVPGVAKTLAVETLARTVSGSFSRLQFTPDLVPSDIVGTRIYRPGSERFDTELGPIMANFVLADEINRAPAKVQSALLEVMAERQVSIGGQRYPVPSPFLVLATQNPIESEGVYPLPEAQRDRFLMKISVDYPSPAEEREIVYRMGVEPPSATAVISTDELARLQASASRVFVHHSIVDYVVRLVFATRHPAQHGLPEVE
jgi:MoxR-like ATPase